MKLCELPLVRIDIFLIGTQHNAYLLDMQKDEATQQSCNEAIKCLRQVWKTLAALLRILHNLDIPCGTPRRLASLQWLTACARFLRGE